MPEEIQAITLQNLDDAVYLMNESSRGMSFEYNLEMFGFLSLARYWNFSYEHSLIRYVENEPAALIINCVDTQAHDAFTFYWGAIPKFRSRKIALSLFDTSCQQLLHNGYNMLYGDAVPDRAVRRYRFIQAEAQHLMVQLQAQTPNLPIPNAEFEVRVIEPGVLEPNSVPVSEFRHWCQRHSFLRNAASFLQLVGAFRDKALQGYMVVFPQTSHTFLLDIVSFDSSLEVGYELLRWLVVNDYRPPFIATYVFEQSYASSLLPAAGFREQRTLCTLSRDLHATCRAKAS